MTTQRLVPEQLRRRCDPSQFPFQDTSELPVERTVYGQPRGLRAIEFGLAIDSQGYNTFVLGPTDAGQVSSVRQFIADRAAQMPTPDDWCYVHNFKQSQRPKALRLPAGMGTQLRDDMQKLIDILREEIPRVLEDPHYLTARNKISNELEDKSQDLLNHIQLMAAQYSLAIQTTPNGATVIMALVDGEPISPDAFDQLSEDARATITENRRKLENQLEDTYRTVRDLRMEAESSLDGLRRDVAEQVIEIHISEIIKKYDLSGSAIQYFWAVRDDILNALEVFEKIPPSEASEDLESAREDVLKRYQVNVFVEHNPNSGAPVVFMDFPTYQNLLGRIEHEVAFGIMLTDLRYIKPGALHQANGGFLIVRATDILKQPFAWDALKRSLNTGQVIIEDAETPGMSVIATQQLEPEPISISVKVILIGTQTLYYLMHEYEEDFRDLFRVKADFGEKMPRTIESEQHYASFIATRCHEENLPHFSSEAVGQVVDFGSRLISDQRRLSTSFGDILPLIREAAFFARKNGRDTVYATDVAEAIREQEYRNNEIEEISLERIADGIILLDVAGSAVGQVNGLSVINFGDHAFGLPDRITARVYMGRDSVVQIDRESDLTGPLHDKGVMTLGGYLGGRYAQDYPLTLTASISFEQNYGGVEGDSASSTELYALLSALSGFPVRQDLAVTGSINQNGNVQPIGGVTQKVEGFYKACKTLGFTGTQGVVIPQGNIPELMLSDEVIEAVREERFHVYAVATVDDGIALLTSQPAETVHQAVDTKLRDLAEKLVNFEDGNTSDDDDEDEG